MIIALLNQIINNIRHDPALFVALCVIGLVAFYFATLIKPRGQR